MRRTIIWLAALSASPSSECDNGELGAGLCREKINHWTVRIGQGIVRAVANLRIVRRQLPAALFADHDDAVDQIADEAALALGRLGQCQRIDAPPPREIGGLVIDAIPARGKGAIGTCGQRRPCRTKRRFAAGNQTGFEGVGDRRPERPIAARRRRHEYRQDVSQPRQAVGAP